MINSPQQNLAKWHIPTIQRRCVGDCICALDEICIKLSENRMFFSPTQQLFFFVHALSSFTRILLFTGYTTNTTALASSWPKGSRRVKSILFANISWNSSLIYLVSMNCIYALYICLLRMWKYFQESIFLVTVIRAWICSNTVGMQKKYLGRVLTWPCKSSVCGLRFGLRLWWWPHCWQLKQSGSVRSLTFIRVSSHIYMRPFFLISHGLWGYSTAIDGDEWSVWQTAWATLRASYWHTCTRSHCFAWGSSVIEGRLMKGLILMLLRRE